MPHQHCPTCGHSRLQDIVESLNQAVRPTIALIFALGVVLLAWRSAVTITSDLLAGLIGMVFGFFFQSRTSEKAIDKLEQKNEELVQLARQSPPLPPQEPRA